MLQEISLRAAFRQAGGSFPVLLKPYGQVHEHSERNCPTTEQAVKEIVMGRKNWLFSQSSTGAKAMAIIMSILETAKQNGLDQFKYINYLLDKLPNELSLLDTQRLEAYLPWAENVQLHCK